MASIAAAIASPGATLLVMDVAFGAPRGLAPTLTGRPHAPALWDWIAARHEDDARNRTNYREVAAEMNSHFPGSGPFWGNGLAREVPGLPRKKPALPPHLPRHRETELAGRADGARPFPIWQLAGAGVVGAQSLTAMAMLARLRSHFGADLSIWPFDPPGKVTLAETYLSLQPEEVARRVARGRVKDAAQAGAMALGFLRLAKAGHLARLFAPGAAPEVLQEEGWYLGAGEAALVRSAFGLE